MLTGFCSFFIFVIWGPIKYAVRSARTAYLVIDSFIITLKNLRNVLNLPNRTHRKIFNYKIIIFVIENNKMDKLIYNYNENNKSRSISNYRRYVCML